MDLGGGSLRHWCPQSQGQMAAPPGRVGVDTCLGIDAEIWVEGCISQLPRALPWVQRILLGVGVLGPQDWEGAHWRLQAVLLSAAPRDSLGLGLLPGVLRAAVSSPARLVCGSPWGASGPAWHCPHPGAGRPAGPLSCCWPVIHGHMAGSEVGLGLPRVGSVHCSQAGPSGAALVGVGAPSPALARSWNEASFCGCPGLQPRPGGRRVPSWHLTAWLPWRLLRESGH